MVCDPKGGDHDAVPPASARIIASHSCTCVVFTEHTSLAVRAVLCWNLKKRSKEMFPAFRLFLD